MKMKAINTVIEFVHLDGGKSIAHNNHFSNILLVD